MLYHFPVLSFYSIDSFVRAMLFCDERGHVYFQVVFSYTRLVIAAGTSAVVIGDRVVLLYEWALICDVVALFLMRDVSARVSIQHETRLKHLFPRLAPFYF